ncbi:MAG: holin [Faecalibacterium prausnitzii]|nr:holin [Faecalibacterium prausnitzii]
MNTIDITPIVNAALALIGAGVSVFLIPWLKKQTTEAQRKELTAWVKIGVAAAEQLYVGQGRGEEKKQYVLDFLKQKGFKVDEESVVNAIEAIVKQLNTEVKLKPGETITDETLDELTGGKGDDNE